MSCGGNMHTNPPGHTNDILTGVADGRGDTLYLELLKTQMPLTLAVSVGLFCMELTAP